MAVGLPLKTTYANGDVYSASDVNDTNGTINANLNPYCAGKNKIINGDFRFNQRGFTSNTTSATYNFDRWTQINGGTTGTLTITPQTFTLGTAPVAGYEARNFVQCVTASGASVDTFAILAQRIESVRTLAGSTATISFWAKANSGTPKIGVEIEQDFGSGGGASGAVDTSAGAVTLSTSWARYSLTVAIPSIAGKTVGTNGFDQVLLLLWLSGGSNFNSRSSSIGLQNNTFQIWGVQVEQGSTATAFQTASGTIQGELALCQRYYYRQTVSTNYGYLAFGMCNNSTSAKIQIPLPVPMRSVPVGLDTPTASTLRVTDGTTGTTLNGTPTLDSDTSNSSITFNVGVASGLTQYRAIWFGANNSSSAYIGFSAEL